MEINMPDAHTPADDAAGTRADASQPAPDDGRNPDWEPDSVPLAAWEAVLSHGPLSGPDVARLLLALDTLAAAERLEAAIVAGEFGAARDEVAAYREVRSARTAAAAEVARLTGERGARGPARKPNAMRRNRSTRQMLAGDDA
jgi:hypothetical protein